MLPAQLGHAHHSAVTRVWEMEYFLRGAAAVHGYLMCFGISARKKTKKSNGKIHWNLVVERKSRAHFLLRVAISPVISLVYCELENSYWSGRNKLLESSLVIKDSNWWMIPEVTLQGLLDQSPLVLKDSYFWMWKWNVFCFCCCASVKWVYRTGLCHGLEPCALENLIFKLKY